MKGFLFLSASLLILSLSSCVSKKKLLAAEAKYNRLDSFYVKVQQDLKACRDSEEASARRKAQLEAESTQRAAGVIGRRGVSYENSLFLNASGVVFV